MNYKKYILFLILLLTIGFSTSGWAQNPNITSSTSAIGTLGAPFSYTIVATENPTSFSSTTLPAGLSLNTSTGVVSGLPTTVATSNVDVTATNASGSGIQAVSFEMVADPFVPFINSIPTITQVISTVNKVKNATPITVDRITYSSKNGANNVFSIIGYPQAAGTYPGIMFLHGGGGNAETMAANVELYASMGYAAIATDLPGICGTTNTPNSTGAWKSRAGGDTSKFEVAIGAGNSTLVDAEVAAIEAFNLLGSQTNVDTDNMGVAGFSWGGYSTTMMAGILKDKVKAAYAVYGCGYYDTGSFWKNRIGILPESVKNTWLTYLDAGRRAPQITAPYFLEAASNDTFFWPEAVSNTLDAIPGTKNHTWGPNYNHKRFPSSGTMMTNYFNHYLKSTGNPFGSVSITDEVTTVGGIVSIDVDLPAGEAVSKVALYYSVPTGDWQSRNWISIAASLVSGTTYQATIPANIASQNVDYYAYLTDTRTTVTSSYIYNTSGQPSDNGSIFNSATFVSQVVPKTIDAGSTVSVSVTMSNTGTTTWTADDKHRLGSQIAPDNAIWGFTRVVLDGGDNIAPGQQKTFTFDITAPTVSGPYNFQWKMLQESIEWFGGESENVSIFVGDLCPDDPNKLDPGLCGCGVVEDTCPPSNLIVNSGTGDGDYAPFEEVTITANPAPEGKEFDTWSIISGSPSILYAENPSTTMTVGASNAEITATYKELSKVNGATFVSQQLPGFIQGETVSVSVTMKNTGTSRWTKDNYYLGSQSPQDNQHWGINRVELEEGESVLPESEKIFTFNITVPSQDGSYIFQWKMIENGVEWFGDLSSIQPFNVGGSGSYFDDCDSKTAWGPGGTLNLSSQNKVQGAAALEYTGDTTPEYFKVFSTPYDAQGTESGTVLQFWYYVSDPTPFETANQVEISSSGAPDTDEYSWNLGSNLNAGWNFIQLNAKDASKIGNPDLSAINWFRLYRRKSGTVTTRIDAIQLIGENSLAANEIETQKKLNVYPNPVDNEIYINFTLSKAARVSITLMNMNGQIVLQKDNSQKLNSGNQTVEIPVEHLNSGVYITRIKIDEEVFIKKVIIE